MISFWIVTFVISGSLLVLLVILKMVQDRFRILLFWPDARDRIEMRLVNKRAFLHKRLETFSTKNFYIVLHYVILRLKKFLARMHTWLDKKSFHLISLIRGKQNTERHTRDKVSYFLHDIGNFRERFKKK